MTIHKCDLCHKDISNDDDRRSVRISFDFRSDYETVELELCEECQKEFVKNVNSLIEYIKAKNEVPLGEAAIKKYNKAKTKESNYSWSPKPFFRIGSL